MTRAISLSGAVSVVGGFPALTGVDLVVEQGELVLLRGPNGAGKTTLLRLCAGIAPLSSGEAEIFGMRLPERRREVRRSVCLSPAEGFLYEELSVAENLRFWSAALSVREEDVRRSTQAFGLGSLPGDVEAGRLSTGQRRRVELAIVVARRARLWLLDEPHAGLDQEARRVVDAILVRAVEQGATVVVASHEMELGELPGAREVFLDGGAVVTDVGSSRESLDPEDAGETSALGFRTPSRSDTGVPPC